MADALVIDWEKRSERRIIAVKGGNRRVVRVGDKLGGVCPLRLQ